MKKSTIKKFEKRRNSLPIYFVDSSVFLEALFGQEHCSECMAFFNNTGFRYRLMSSIEAMGEVIKSLNEEGYEAIKEKGMFLLSQILVKANVGIVSPTFESINNVHAIREEEPFIKPSDCIIFSTAITENCFAFVTLDRHFTPMLCNKFKITLKKPSEA